MLSGRISRNIGENIYFDLTLVPPVKIPIFTFLLPRLIAHASQPDGNMTSFNLHFSRGRNIVIRCYAEGVRHGERRNRTVLDFDIVPPRKG